MNPEGGRLTRWHSIDQRLWERVQVTDSCWLWLGSLTEKGYGCRIGHDGRYFYPHQLSFTLLKGAVPEGLVLDHLCRVRHCVNPDHLEPVTAEENTRRGVDARWHEPCPNGHSPSHRRRLPSGQNVCVECRRISDRIRYETHKDKRREAARLRYALKGRADRT